MAGTTHASRPAPAGTTGSARRRPNIRARVRSSSDGDVVRLRELIWSKTHEERLAAMSPEAREQVERIARLRQQIGVLPGFSVVRELRRTRNGE